MQTSLKKSKAKFTPIVIMRWRKSGRSWYEVKVTTRKIVLIEGYANLIKLMEKQK